MVGPPMLDEAQAVSVNDIYIYSAAFAIGITAEVNDGACVALRPRAAARVGTGSPNGNTRESRHHRLSHPPCFSGDRLNFVELVTTRVGPIPPRSRFGVDMEEAGEEGGDGGGELPHLLRSGNHDS